MVWAEAVWVPTPHAWREVRSTEPGLLSTIPGRAAPPEGAARQEGGFSVVVEAGPGRGVRKLPSLYVNDVQLYADRDVTKVGAMLERAVDAFVHSGERATYMLTACEIGGRRGLYGADFFNRTRFRLELQRAGMRFSQDAFVVLRDDGSFESDDFAAFDPSFLILAPWEAGEAASMRPSAAALVHQLAYFRIADLGVDELRRLPATLARMDVVGATTAEVAVRALAV